MRTSWRKVPDGCMQRLILNSDSNSASKTLLSTFLGGKSIPTDSFMVKRPMISFPVTLRLDKEISEEGKKVLREENVNTIHDLFNNSNPIMVDIGSGYGQWTLQKALEHKQINWLAIESKVSRVQSILSKILFSELDNIVVARSDAFLLINELIPDNSIDAVGYTLDVFY